MEITETFRRGLDRVLEAAVVPSWSRIGFLLRRRLWHWDGAVAHPMTGRVVVVTGGTQGIGRATATALAQVGASVGIVGREPERCEQVAAEIAASTGSVAWAEVADLGSRGDVEALATRLRERLDRLDGLVHAAGILSRDRRSSEDGTELTVAVHVIGPHLLTARLVPLLAAGAPAAVVWVSSGGMYAQRLRVDRLDDPAEPYRGTVAYARAKRAQVVLARLWHDRLAASGISCSAMHPGWVDTAALREGLPRFAGALAPILRRAPEGADTVAWLASGAADGGAAGIWLDRAPRSAYRWPVRREPPSEAERLWRWCDARAGLGNAVAGREP